MTIKRPSKMILTAILLGAASVALAATVSAASGGAGPQHSGTRHPSGQAPPDTFTPLVATPLADARPVVGADGRRHIPYELQLINPTGVAITIESVRTVDPTSGELLGELEGAALAALMFPLGETSEAPTVGPGGAAFMLMDVSLAMGEPVPRSLAHDFILSYEPAVDGAPTEERSGFTKVIREKPVVVDRPLRGARWIDTNGCCVAPTSHRIAWNTANGNFYVAQRFAIDFLQLDDDGRLFTGSPEELESWPGYGAEVLSVAAGRVVRTRDGLPDNVPVGTTPPPDVATAPGNYVVVDIGRGRFAGYGHLQPGSLTVEVGDRVQRGQVLGLLGNSGNSDAPHLHFQVIDGPSFLGSDGSPYVFRSFESEGTLANGDEVVAGGAAMLDPALSGSHSRRLPLDLQVVSFGP